MSSSSPSSSSKTPAQASTSTSTGGKSNSSSSSSRSPSKAPVPAPGAAAAAAAAAAPAPAVASVFHKEAGYDPIASLLAAGASLQQKSVSASAHASTSASSSSSSVAPQEPLTSLGSPAQHLGVSQIQVAAEKQALSPSAYYMDKKGDPREATIHRVTPWTGASRNPIIAAELPASVIWPPYDAKKNPHGHVMVTPQGMMELPDHLNQMLALVPTKLPTTREEEIEQKTEFGWRWLVVFETLAFAVFNAYNWPSKKRKTAALAAAEAASSLSSLSSSSSNKKNDDDEKKKKARTGAATKRNASFVKYLIRTISRVLIVMRAFLVRGRVYMRDESKLQQFPYQPQWAIVTNPFDNHCNVTKRSKPRTEEIAAKRAQQEKEKAEKKQQKAEAKSRTKSRNDDDDGGDEDDAEPASKRRKTGKNAKLDISAKDVRALSMTSSTAAMNAAVGMVANQYGSQGVVYACETVLHDRLVCKHVDPKECTTACLTGRPGGIGNVPLRLSESKDSLEDMCAGIALKYASIRAGGVCKVNHSSDDKNPQNECSHPMHDPEELDQDEADEYIGLFLRYLYLLRKYEDKIPCNVFQVFAFHCILRALAAYPSPMKKTISGLLRGTDGETGLLLAAELAAEHLAVSNGMEWTEIGCMHAVLSKQDMAIIFPHTSVKSADSLLTTKHESGAVHVLYRDPVTFEVLGYKAPMRHASLVKKEDVDARFPGGQVISYHACVVQMMNGVYARRIKFTRSKRPRNGGDDGDQYASELKCSFAYSGLAIDRIIAYVFEEGGLPFMPRKEADEFMTIKFDMNRTVPAYQPLPNPPASKDVDAEALRRECRYAVAMMQRHPQLLEIYLARVLAIVLCMFPPQGDVEPEQKKKDAAANQSVRITNANSSSTALRKISKPLTERDKICTIMQWYIHDVGTKSKSEQRGQTNVRLAGLYADTQFSNWGMNCVMFKKLFAKDHPTTQRPLPHRVPQCNPRWNAFGCGDVCRLLSWRNSADVVISDDWDNNKRNGWERAQKELRGDEPPRDFVAEESKRTPLQAFLLRHPDFATLDWTSEFRAIVHLLCKCKSKEIAWTILYCKIREIMQEERNRMRRKKAVELINQGKGARFAKDANPTVKERIEKTLEFHVTKDPVWMYAPTLTLMAAAVEESRLEYKQQLEERHKGDNKKSFDQHLAKVLQLVETSKDHELPSGRCGPNPAEQPGWKDALVYAYFFKIEADGHYYATARASGGDLALECIKHSRERTIAELDQVNRSHLDQSLRLCSWAQRKEICDHFRLQCESVNYAAVEAKRKREKDYWALTDVLAKHAEEHAKKATDGMDEAEDQMRDEPAAAAAAAAPVPAAAAAAAAAAPAPGAQPIDDD